MRGKLSWKIKATRKGCAKFPDAQGDCGTQCRSPDANRQRALCVIVTDASKRQGITSNFAEVSQAIGNGWDVSQTGGPLLSLRRNIFE